MYRTLRDATIKSLPSCEAEVESCCELLVRIGKTFNNPRASRYLMSYLARIRRLSQNQNLHPRIRFMCLDLIVLRGLRWRSINEMDQ